MKIIFFIFSMFTFLFAKTQISTPFNIGGIVFESNQANSFSGPLLMASDKSCIHVSNGVVVFKANSKGSTFFNPICEPFVRDINLSFLIAPNPSPGITKVYMINDPFLPNDLVDLIVNDLSGRVVKKYTCKGSQLKNGFTIETITLSKGTYFIKILSQSLFNSTNANAAVTLKLINSHN